MKDQLVTFETAKLAKEKGFDKNTTSNCWVKLMNGEIIHNSEREDKLEHERTKYYLSQPTQSLLQRWLREKHNLHVSPDINTFGTWDFVVIDLKVNECVKNSTRTHISAFKSYEEALEAGLQEALKLIKK